MVPSASYGTVKLFSVPPWSLNTILTAANWAGFYIVSEGIPEVRDMVLEHEIVESRESAKPDIVSKAFAAASKEKKLLPTI